MRLSFAFALLMASIMGGFWAASAAPPKQYEELEREEDPYLPPIPGDWGFTPRTPPGSVQVNVNSMGQNILGDAANEPSLVIDPTNPTRMAIAWRQFDNVASNFRQAGWAYTTDGGQHWTFPGSLTPGTFRSDPVLASTATGQFFWSTLQSSFCIDVFKSLNSGMTWPTSVPAFGGDKQWLAIDTRTSGQGAGHHYQAWQSGAQCQNTGNLFTRSIDGGATWQTPVPITNNPRFGILTVGPDGEVYVIGAGGSNVAVCRSTNARNPTVTPTWDVAVQGNFLGAAQQFGGVNPAGLLGQFYIAVNSTSGPNRGHVYILCSVGPFGSDPLDVMFSRSTNGGQTWSAPRRVNDDPTTNGAYQWFGTMSVAPNGRIDVIWNDTRDDPNRILTRLYYSASNDEGVTWSPNVPLTPQWDPRLGYPNQNKIGDYYHMVSDNTGAGLAYAATFNGEEDVYYMRISANDCNTNGTPDSQDIAAGAADCNSNGVPDVCEADCNTNGTADSCDVSSASSRDCNTNGLPDECDRAAGASRDCNTNNTLDECDLRSGSATDCNSNGVPDVCDPGREDCNTNGTLDQCEPGFIDCNTNGHLDRCDIAAGRSGDCNANNVPDECDLPAFARASDPCGGAQFITPGVLYQATTTSATTTDAGSGTACSPAAPSGRDVYYKYRPIASGNLTVSMCGNPFFDTVLSVHTACPATGANQLPGACNDDGCGTGGGPSILNNLPVVAGTTYLIRVAGFDNASGGDTGSFILMLTGPTGVGDCNTNGVPDDCEIAAGADANTNGIPDSCDPFPACATCKGDLNGDNVVAADDIQKFVACLIQFPVVDPTCGCADMNGDHQIRGADVALFVSKELSGGCP